MNQKEFVTECVEDVARIAFHKGAEAGIGIIIGSLKELGVPQGTLDHLTEISLQAVREHFEETKRKEANA